MVMIAGKKCKYVGCLLGTTEDINSRKQLTNTAFFKLKHIFTNTYVSEETKLRISNTIATRRLRVFGHICRLPNSAPAKKALYESLTQSKRPKEGQRLTPLN